MDMIKRYRTEIIILSIISAAGIGYFIYSRMRIHNLNNKVQDLEEFQKQIDNLPDVELNENDTIPPDPTYFPSEFVEDGSVTDETTSEYPLYDSYGYYDYNGNYAGY